MWTWSSSQLFNETKPRPLQAPSLWQSQKTSGSYSCSKENATSGVPNWRRRCSVLIFSIKSLIRQSQRSTLVDNELHAKNCSRELLKINFLSHLIFPKTSQVQFYRWGNQELEGKLLTTTAAGWVEGQDGWTRKFTAQWGCCCLTAGVSSTGPHCT